MPFILALLTFVVFVAISYLSELMKKRMLLRTAREGAALQQAEANDPTPAGVPPVAVLPAANGARARVEGYAMPESLFYHQGHSWVALQEPATAFVGIDDFAGKLVGKPTSITLPRVGAQCRQGAKGWTLGRNNKELDMLFPLDGKVAAVNERAIENPEVLMKEPYGRGWLLMVKTAVLWTPPE